MATPFSSLRTDRRALTCFKNTLLDVRAVLLDLTMPVVSGQEALREMKLIDGSIPVIRSSGFNEAEAIRQFTEKGLAGFLQKPYTASELATTVKRVLRERS